MIHLYMYARFVVTFLCTSVQISVLRAFARIYDVTSTALFIRLHCYCFGFPVNVQIYSIAAVTQ